MVERYRSVIELDRYDLSEPLKIRIAKPSSARARREAERYERKHRRKVREQWNQIKMIGIFLIVVLILIIIILLLLAAFVWK